jgi:hypothetical protein
MALKNVYLCTFVYFAATYTQGAVVTLNAFLTANHGGKFSFRVCPRSSSLDEACFGSNYLTRCVVNWSLTPQ